MTNAGISIFTVFTWLIARTMLRVMPVSFLSAYRQLDPNEKAYVDAYVGDTERAAVRAGERISMALYRAIPDTLIAASRGLLERPLVLAAIAERINEIAASSELSVHRLIKEVMTISFSSIGDYMQVGEDGQPWFDLAKCTPEQLAAIKSIEIEEGVRGRKFKFTLHDKMTSLQMLAKYMGVLEADNPHWRNDNIKPIDQKLISKDASVDDASNIYARMINK